MIFCRGCHGVKNIELDSRGRSRWESAVSDTVQEVSCSSQPVHSSEVQDLRARAMPGILISKKNSNTLLKLIRAFLHVHGKFSVVNSRVSPMPF